MAQNTLLERTRQLLRNRRGHYKRIADETGLDIHWLQKLSQGAIEDPGVNKIETLHSYLNSSDFHPTEAN